MTCQHPRRRIFHFFCSVWALIVAHLISGLPAAHSATFTISGLSGKTFNSAVSASFLANANGTAEPLLNPSFTGLSAFNTSPEWAYLLTINMQNTGSRPLERSNNQRRSILEGGFINLGFSGSNFNGTSPFNVGWDFTSGSNTGAIPGAQLIASALNRNTTHTFGFYGHGSVIDIYFNGVLAKTFAPDSTYLYAGSSNNEMRIKKNGSNESLLATFTIEGGALQAEVEAVPEPSSIALGLCGLAGLLATAVVARWRKK